MKKGIHCATHHLIKDFEIVTGQVVREPAQQV
jgi:imidazoleglycerol phosphate dehydratase HisB